MRVTCLKCGHQVELAMGQGAASGLCVCGQTYVYPRVLDMGIRPSPQAAERLRKRAFRAAGLVKNIGGFALGLSLLGVLCFPMALIGAAVAVYVLTMLRGPVGRYSGRAQAIWALCIGVVVFVSETAFLVSWYKEQRAAALASLQEGAGEDLKALWRAQRINYAHADTYAGFEVIGYHPQVGQYTIYLAPEIFVPAMRDGKQTIDPLPAQVAPALAQAAFTAAAVANIDDDPQLDVWTIDSAGHLMHVADDAG